MTLIERVDTRHVAGVTLALYALGTAVDARAADVAAPESDALQEIVVTAQHKVENVQSTPIAMSVYGGDALKENNIVDIASLANYAPDVNFSIAKGVPSSRYAVCRAWTSPRTAIPRSL